MGTFNTYGYKKKKYGGSNPVWLTVSQKERCGGKLIDLPMTDTVLKAGSLVSVDNAGGHASIVKTFRVSKHVAATDLMVEVEAVGCTPMFDDALMKAPTTIDGSGMATGFVAFEHLPDEGIYRLHLSANPLGVLKVGDILISATNIGSNAKICATPTGLTENDVLVEAGVTDATIASVYHGEIMEDRIQPIPACIKALLPMIKFQKGI